MVSADSAISVKAHTSTGKEGLPTYEPKSDGHEKRRSCSTSAIENDRITLMRCPSALSAPTLMGYLYAYNSILQPPTTMRRVDVVLAATPKLLSSGLIRRFSTATIDNDSMALMQCPSALSAPTLMGYLYAYNSILQPPTTMRRVDVVPAATPKLLSSGLIRRCSIAIIDNDSMALMQCPYALSAPTLMGYYFSHNVIAGAVYD